MRIRLIQTVSLLLLQGMTPTATSFAAPVRCREREIEYALVGRLRIADTPLGAGDGIYEIGPGRVVLRIEQGSGDPRSRVKLISYEMHLNFVVKSRVLFWNTKVVTSAVGHASDPSGKPVAEGATLGRTITWGGEIRGYHTDGTLTCSGNVCGSFGAPPRGTTPLSAPPGAVKLAPFEFSADGTTFAMASTLLSRSSTPQQRTSLALAGREVAESCVRTESP
jgi:hypothetical protein